MVGAVLFRLLGNCLSKFDVGEQIVFLHCFISSKYVAYIPFHGRLYTCSVGVEESPLPRLFV